MTKPETLKDLMIASDLTVGEARRIAAKLFDGRAVVDQTEVPYHVVLPVLDDLPDHVQQFIVKAILESRIINYMDDVPVMAEDIVDEPHPDEDEPSVDPYEAIDAEIDAGADVDSCPPKDGEFNG